MHITTLTVIWVCLSILIKNCTSSFVPRVLNRRLSERTLFNSAEDFYTSDISAENDDLQSEFSQLPDADVHRIGISDFGFNMEYSDLSTWDKIHPALERMDHESAEELGTQTDNKCCTALTNAGTERELSVSKHSLIFGINHPERKDPGVNQQKSIRVRDNQDMESLGEEFGSQSLQWESNLEKDLFGYKTEGTSEETEFVKINEAVSGESLENTKDTLRKWLVSANIDLIPEKIGSSTSDKDWSESYVYQHTDNWSSNYEGDVNRKISDQEWYPDTHDMSLEIAHEDADVKFACVTDELWSRFVANGRTEYNNCEFTCDCEAMREEQSRWKRFVIRVPGCREGSRRIRRTCRKVWGNSRTAGAHPVLS
jgi:hypothetical protein